MLKIINYPNEILTKPQPLFDFSNPIMDPQLLVKEMLEVMYESGGIGLAANQVGIPTRMFVMGNKQHPEVGQGFFNPVILEVSPEILDMHEGCLSFPKIYVKIKRPATVKAKWQDVSGEWKEGEFSNYGCKCFLHEYDHLEGITFKDRISLLKWDRAVKQKRKYNDN